MEGEFPGPEDPSPPYGRSAHPYFLYEMIRSQPKSVRATIRETVRSAERIPPPPPGRPLLLVGMGTSFHSALASAWGAGSILGDHWEPRAVDSFELLLRPDLVRRAGAAIVYSSSGETALTLRAQEALKSAGVRQILVSGTAASRSSAMADHVLPTIGAEERAWVHTISYTTAIAASLALFGRWANASAPDVDRLGAALDEVVGREGEWKSVAERIRDRPNLLLLGSGAARATAREAALKLREGAGRFVAAAGVEEFLHGILPSVDESTAVLAVTTSGFDRRRATTALAAAAVAGAKTVHWGRRSSAESFEGPELPGVEPQWTPLIDIVPLQFVTYWLAVGEDRNPDVMGYDDPRIFAARRTYGI